MLVSRPACCDTICPRPRRARIGPDGWAGRRRHARRTNGRWPWQWKSRSGVSSYGDCASSEGTFRSLYSARSITDMRSTLCISSTFLLATVGPGLGSAQVCAGEATFSGSPARFFASAAVGSSSIYHGGLAYGRSLLFGSVDVGMTTYQHGETLDYRGAFG